MVELGAMTSEAYDIIIIGGGAAGFTAGLYAARDRRKTLLLERFSAGGQVLNCERIENFPGFPDGIAGYTLGPFLQQQATQMGLEVKLAAVEEVRLDSNHKALKTTEGEFFARTLIIAAGSSFARLGIPGEEEFAGKGVSHCASCDGAFFMGQPVAVVGGGDAALDEGVHLTQYASKVLLCHRREELKAGKVLQERALANNKLEFHWNTVVQAIEGDDVVKRIQVENLQTGETSLVSVAGVFIYVGLTPNSQFLAGLVPLDGGGHIITDIGMRTKVPGVLAAGDIRQHSARQLISAAGDGATAALAAIHYLRTGEWSVL
jgi:thioredoxin reductase (NADPH)